MTQEQWLGAAIIGAVMFFLFAMSRNFSRKSYVMSRLTMMLLLDEFAYRQQRIQFLKLIETLRVKNSLALLHAAMLSLEDEAIKAAETKTIGPRMWQLNQRAIQTGESLTDLLEKPATTGDDLRGIRREPYSDSQQHAEMGDKIAKISIALLRFKRRLLGLLGI